MGANVVGGRWEKGDKLTGWGKAGEIHLPKEGFPQRFPRGSTGLTEAV